MMKFCPYCGAQIINGAAFCMHCGKAIPEKADPILEPVSESIVPDPESQQYPGMHSEPTPLRRRQRLYHEQPEEVIDQSEPVQIAYDGYYDDVLPTDESNGKEPLDKDLIKRIALVGAGALLIIGLAVLAMYFL